MSRFTRINAIWRKELLDTLRDRRTLVAMVLVPMVLYPALMLGSLQALEVQVSYLVTERYDIAVPDEATQRWLRRMIDSDPARQPLSGAAEERVAVQDPSAESPSTQPKTSSLRGGPQAARASVRDKPPEYRVFILPNVAESVGNGIVHAGVILDGPPPESTDEGSRRVRVVYNESDVRSEIAGAGVAGVLERVATSILAQRLARQNLDISFVEPIRVQELNIATPEQMTGHAMGQVVPLILILMTLTGAIYPAIDLTAGERERGTLETLMVAPVPTTDLIAGKFIVVTLIGLLSAVLNLLSVGGTIYFGGLGSMLTRGAPLILPLSALPWIMLLLIPLAVMFSATLLAVCSFARSFKEAQNYIVPVMMGALIPGVVGILPGTKLEGPILIMPVANIVVLTRELFVNHFDAQALLWVLLSTSLYAGTAVAVAAKLFGQEAVLFADSGSVKTLFQRKFFQRRKAPTIAASLLVLAIVYSLNFYVQNGFQQSGYSQGRPFLIMLGLTLVTLFVLLPWAAALYLRIDTAPTFLLRRPSPRGLLAGTCFGLSTWVLVYWWASVQKHLLPVDEVTRRSFEAMTGWINEIDVGSLIFFMAFVPALCEEFFFRGFVLSGVRTSLGRWASIGIVALAFGLSHHSAHRIVQTTVLGLLLGALAVSFRSIWPCMLAHFMHNGISIAASRTDALAPLLAKFGFSMTGDGQPPLQWIVAAAVLTGIGLALCLSERQPDERADPLAQLEGIPVARD
jgi:sodium transport system permease protein